jgi:predicted nucleic acid-binding protein
MPTPGNSLLLDTSVVVKHFRYPTAADKETSVFYGQIAAGLARAGTPIPQNDIWIAALARQSGLPVATTDDHFDRVTN